MCTSLYEDNLSFCLRRFVYAAYVTLRMFMFTLSSWLPWHMTSTVYTYCTMIMAGGPTLSLNCCLNMHDRCNHGGPIHVQLWLTLNVLLYIVWKCIRGQLFRATLLQRPLLLVVLFMLYLVANLLCLCWWINKIFGIILFLNARV